MLAIKLRRIGKKHQAAFRIIVSEKRSKVDGRYTDNIGWLNPNSKEFNIKKEKAQYWLKNGAQPTDTVYNLFIKAGIIEGRKKSVHKKKKVKKGETKDVAGKKVKETAAEVSTETAKSPNAESDKKIESEIEAPIEASGKETEKPKEEIEQPKENKENK